MTPSLPRHAFLVFLLAGTVPGVLATAQMNLAWTRLGLWETNTSGTDLAEIRFGTPLTMDTTSKNADGGSTLLRIYTTFFDWLNHVHGGISIDGRKRKASLSLIEDRSDGDVAKRATEYLLNDGIELFLGPYGSDLSEAMADVINGTRSLAIIPVAAAAHVYADRPRVFGMMTPSHKAPEDTFKYLEGKVSTVAVVMTDDLFSRSACRDVRHYAATYGMSVVKAVNFTTDDDDESFAQMVAELKQAKPDFLVGCTTYDACERYIIEARNQDFVPQVHFNTQCVGRPEFLERVKDPEGTSLAGRWVWGATPWTHQVQVGSDAGSINGAYRELYGEDPPDFAASVLSSCFTYLLAIEATNSIDPEVLAEYLRTARFDTIWGPVQFDENRQNTNAWKILQYGPTSESPRVILPEVDPGRQDSRFVALPSMPMPPWGDRVCYNSDATLLDDVYGFDDGGKCRSCPEHQVSVFDPDVEKRFCRNCPAGRVAVDSTSKLLRVCAVDCEPGFVPNPDNPLECQPCAPGNRVGPDNKTCLACEVGRFNDVQGATFCKVCPVGRAATVSGMRRCQECPLGRIAAYTGADSCMTCVAGTYADSRGQSECLHCPLGRVAEKLGMATCDDCPAGKHASWGNRECLDCAVGRFQPEVGRSACLSQEDYYGTACPDVGMDRPVNGAGYWMGMTPNTSTWKPEVCKFSRYACLAFEKCAKGHTGRQCLACQPGWAPAEPAGRCIKCLPRVYYLIVLCVVIILIVGICIVFAHMVAAAATRPKDVHSILFKQLLGHFITMSVAHTLFANVLNDVVGQQVARRNEQKTETISTSTVELATWIISLLGTFDGSLPAEIKGFSMTCLTQPSFGEGSAAMFKRLGDSSHTEFFSLSMKKPRDLFTNLVAENELTRMVFWGTWPLLLITVAYLYGYFKLTRYVRRRADHYANALEFYSNVYRSGFAEASSKYRKRVWSEFIKFYYTNIWEIWWPIGHAQHYLQTGRVSTRLFMEESYPIGLAVVIMSYGTTLRGVMRPLTCVSLDGADENLSEGQFVMLRQSQLVCSFTDPFLFWCPLLLCIIWGFIFPFVTWLPLWRYKTQAKGSKQSTFDPHTKWGILTNGYQNHRWWWETVVYVRKAVCLSLEVMPGRTEIRVLFFFWLALLFLSLHFFFDPYDKRCRGLLDWLELGQLVVWMTSSLVALFISTKEPGSVELIGLCLLVVVMHCVYTAIAGFYLALHFMSNIASKMDKDDEVGQEAGWLKPIKPHMLALYRKLEGTMPYVAFDHWYGWISICGNRGDEAVPPYIPKGRDTIDSEGEICRPLLSTAPSVPERFDDGASVKSGGASCRRDVQNHLMSTIRHISINVGSAFSVSLLDFVIRAAFVLGRANRSRLEEDRADVVEHVDAGTWATASVSHNPLELVGVSGRDSVQAHIGVVEDDDYRKYQAKGKNLQQDLLSTGAAVLKSRRVAEAITDFAEKIVGQKMTALATDAAAKATDAATAATAVVGSGAAKTVAGAITVAKVVENTAKGAVMAVGVTGDEFPVQSRGDEVVDAGDVDAAAADEVADNGSEERVLIVEVTDDDHAREAKRQKAMHERYTQLVQEMFEPATFRRGLQTNEIEFALIQLRNASVTELGVWLDLFEERWVHERVAAGQQLSRIAQTLVEAEVVAKLDQEARDASALLESLRAESFDEATQTDFVQDEMPLPPQAHVQRRQEPSLSAALQWLRIVMQLNGGINVFKVTNLSMEQRANPEVDALLRKLGVNQRRAHDLEKRRIQCETECNRLVQAELQMLRTTKNEPYRLSQQLAQAGTGLHLRRLGLSGDEAKPAAKSRASRLVAKASEFNDSAEMAMTTQNFHSEGVPALPASVEVKRPSGTPSVEAPSGSKAMLRTCAPTTLARTCDPPW